MQAEAGQPWTTHVHHRRGNQDKEPQQQPVLPRLRREQHQEQHGALKLPTFKEFRREHRTDAIAVPLGASAASESSQSGYKTRPRRGLLLSLVEGEQQQSATNDGTGRKQYIYSRPYQDAEEKADSAADDADMMLGDATGKQLLILKIAGDDAFTLGIGTVKEKISRDKRSATGMIVLEETAPTERATPQQVETMISTVTRRKGQTWK
jgi:hypothetical protein